jgi:hypothetical protein
MKAVGMVSSAGPVAASSTATASCCMTAQGRVLRLRHWRQFLVLVRRAVCPRLEPLDGGVEAGQRPAQYLLGKSPIRYCMLCRMACVISPW